jgi:hypothetical protein
MKAKLIKVDDIYTLMDGDKMIASSDSDFQTDYEVMKLSKQNCDEIFGVIDVEEIALSKASYFGGTYRNPEGFSDKQVGYLHGFIEGAELNKDKLFTVEDMRKVFNRGYDLPEYLEKDIMNEIFDDYIKSLQQPTEIEVEMIYDRDCYSGAGWCDKLTMSQCIMCTPVYPLKDENGCLILKKK